MRFEFTTATRIIFGAGTLPELGKVAANFGHHALVVTASNPERAAPLFDILKAQGIAYSVFSVTGEPTIGTARLGKSQAQEADCDFVIGIGGGSAIDTGKAIAVLLSNTGDPLDYLEIIGRGQPIKNPSKPFIAIPTTAGTGSEVTSNAVLFSQEHQVKVSLRSPLMLARLALVDSILTHSSPPDVTAQSGLDALTQVIEPFVSNRANPLTDSICREGMTRAARSLRRAYKNGDDAAAREDMSLTALFGGLALANAKLGAVHGLAGPIGGMFDAPHGGICARLLPFVMEANILALRSRQPESDALQRYNEVARLLTGNPRASAEEGIAWVHELCAALHIPHLGQYGVRETDYPILIERAAAASSMQGNSIKLTPDDLREILTKAQ
jgi:alcohol dehydrogenase class IV